MIPEYTVTISVGTWGFEYSNVTGDVIYEDVEGVIYTISN